jgi:AraC-like DNA-binding protein
VGQLSVASIPASAARFVDAFWCFEARTAVQHRVLPDGCIDFLFDLVTGEARVIGPMQSAEVVSLPARTRLFGVRFLPGAASVFLGVEASALVDAAAPLSELTRAKRYGLVEGVVGARGDGERGAVVARFIAEQSMRSRPLDRRIEAAVGLLARPRTSVCAVAQAVGLGERQLARLFRERVGLGPKHYARIARLERTLGLSRAKALAAGSSSSQAELAARAGYADESHLLRDFRDLVGLTPAALRAERGEVAAAAE